MKRSWVLACSFALVATASFAQLPSAAPVTLDEIFAPAEGCAIPETGPRDETVLAASMEKAACTASCGSTSVTCSYTPPATCVAVDRNCSANQRGYVTCNGVTTYCPTACPICTEGNTRIAPWGGACCENGYRLRYQQQCVNGQWVNTGVTYCIVACDGINPEY